MNSFCEANSSSMLKNISKFLRHPKTYYRLHLNQQLGPTLNQRTEANSLTLCVRSTLKVFFPSLLIPSRFPSNSSWFDHPNAVQRALNCAVLSVLLVLPSSPVFIHLTIRRIYHSGERLPVSWCKLTNASQESR